MTARSLAHASGLSPFSIAIVGIAGRFPGAESVESLWDQVLANRSAIRDVTVGDWGIPPADVVTGGSREPDRATSSRAGLLGDFEVDDAGLLPAELLQGLSRHAKLTLRVGMDTWRTVRSRVAPERASVILANILLPTDGAARVAAQVFLPEEGRSPPLSPLDAFPAALPAGLLARALGLGGGSFTLDAACASSLYALSLACADLEAERADAVLCGGVSLPQSIYTQVGFSQLQALSPSGRCLPYDEAADGLVVGEGAAMVVLKRLDDAVRDRDDILGVIRGVGLSNDVGGSLLSPESEGQLRAMRAAYAQAGWSPEDVDLVEGHGTGTPRGDTVELASLEEVWRGSRRSAVLGSVKGNVGHLLTAAGITGLSKLLSALRAKTLPPSLGRPPSRGAGAFRVLSSPEPWSRRAPGVPRRAALSAFGFGGINAHLLVEEHVGGGQESRSPRARAPLSIAIVGMAAHVGRLDSLERFERALLFGESVDDAPSSARWRGVVDRLGARGRELEKQRGAFLESISLPRGRFKLPPNDVPKVLPQQLLALKVVREALLDALPLGEGPHLGAGVVVGLGLDLETTSFHLRWHARALVQRWTRERGLELSESEIDGWVRDLREASGPALDATRTLGALGGIVPSRVARELQLGGPSFAVMQDQASGLRAVEVAARMLERGEVDRMIACAVDIAGDVRAVVARASLSALSMSGEVRPFDRSADGAKVAEGAVALVLRRLEDAEAAGERVYAVIRGIGAAGGGALDVAPSGPVERAYVRAARSAYEEARTDPSRVGLVEAHGSGIPEEDAVEARALGQIFGAGDQTSRTALASVAGPLGQAGAAASLVSLARAALCLHRAVIPGGSRVVDATEAIAWSRHPFYLPRLPEAWLRDRADGARIAAVSTVGLDGTCMHAVLEGRVVRPLPLRRAGIFLVRGAEQAQRLSVLCAERTGLGIDALAAEWHAATKGESPEEALRAIVATSADDLRAQLGRPPRRAEPVEGSLAIVFPGSGNHFLGMGRELALAMPDVYRKLDEEVLHLGSHLAPGAVTPRRASWSSGWEDEARRELTSKTERVIVAQVAHGVAVHDALRAVGVRPDAFIGYSLGESAALFASRTWRDRDTMFQRTLASPLFKTTLAGPMRLIAEAWGEGREWKVAIVPRPASRVRAALAGRASLLIVNAPDECVIGGQREDVDRVAASLDCHAIELEGVPSVHLSLVNNVRDEYHAHHTLETTPPPGVRFYSGALGAAYEVTQASAAEATTLNAVHGFDFPRVIERAYADGVRIFVEAGPQGSCARMIRKILQGKEHVTVSACSAGEDGYASLLGAVATLAEAGVAVSLDALYAVSSESARRAPSPPLLPAVVVGGVLPPLPSPPLARPRRTAPTVMTAALAHAAPSNSALSLFFAASEATTKAHEMFLLVAQESLALQTSLLMGVSVPEPLSEATPRFDRASCLEFAVGKLARVFGEAFAEVDGFKTRVRLPGEPLMLVDRIVSIEGEMGSLGSGRVVTEHDVLENAWYLDGDRAPVCISVEAGQADLFLSAYLGIDRQTRGERVYRLLDAKIVFHRELPRPGERVRYDIRIDRFIRQGDTWLFFFRFDGSIGGQPFITMFEGCAGFFSKEQLESGRGIVPRTPGAARHVIARQVHPFRPLVPSGATTLSSTQVEALRAGDLAAAFGAPFEGRTLAAALRLPRDRMKLVDRITFLDPEGGSEGKGEVVGEADVQRDAWYLTCHFKDDEVMPGTLMYECCLHTLRVLLLRLGWVAAEATDAYYGPVLGVASELRCRGQVTEATKVVRYRVTILEIGYDPAPFVLARASMFADDKHVVQMEGMSLKLYGLTREAVESSWIAPAVSLGPVARDPRWGDEGRGPVPPNAPRLAPARLATFDRDRIVAYAEGNPSECFGDAYKPFDRDRRLARLPRDPYLFVDRVTAVEQRPWVLEPGGWVTCEHDLSPSAWYFDAGGQRSMPFAVLLEAALQPCGWLAAYLGSALLSDVDLHFRNLDGQGTQLAEVQPTHGALTMRARLTKTSQAGGMILQEFDLEIRQGDARVYEGKTGFGFFPSAALAAQVGIRGAGEIREGAGDAIDLRRESVSSPSARRLPNARLLMVDEVVVEPRGGRRGLGRGVGTKRVDPGEWFFLAHFHQDPVMPGSLGLEALLTVMKQVALVRFPDHARTHRFESMAIGRTHRWQYRGQVVRENERVTVEAEITRVEEGESPLMVADGHLAVDGRVIYAMHDFAVRLVPEARG